MCDFSNNGSSCGDDAGQCNFSNKGNNRDDDVRQCNFSNKGNNRDDDVRQCNFSNKGNNCDDDVRQGNFSNKGNSHDGDESTAATTAATAAAYENSAFIYPSSLQAQMLQANGMEQKKKEKKLWQYKSKCVQAKGMEWDRKMIEIKTSAVQIQIRQCSLPKKTIVLWDITLQVSLCLTCNVHL